MDGSDALGSIVAAIAYGWPRIALRPSLHAVAFRRDRPDMKAPAG
jgi:hypothetical protein